MMSVEYDNYIPLVFLPGSDGNYEPCPELMTEQELIRFLRIPEVSKSKDYRNVVANLKRVHDLPRIHIAGRTLFPIREVMKWISENTTTGR